MNFPNSDTFIDEVYNTQNAAWEQTALDVFRYQYMENKLYRQYCDLLKVSVNDVNTLTQIPFLPIQLFKTGTITSGEFKPELIFESSATTGSIVSRHFVKDSKIYEQSFGKGFEMFYGHPGKYCILGLLPSYLERENSSLVYMVNRLVKMSGNERSGFYLDNHKALFETISQNEQSGIPTLLIGVTYALLDFADQYPMQLNNSIIMETGGMKGRRAELTRQEVHAHLINNLGITYVHSEYGMTELLSQAYSTGQGIFECTPTMKILIRSEDDPFDVNTCSPEKEFITGAINVVDLSNIFSCAFVATDDIAKLYKDGKFEVLGRMDNSDIRGCSLMVL